jgi:hypothetical protein
MKTIVERGWNTTVREKPQYWGGGTPTTVPLCPPQTSHGLTPESNLDFFGERPPEPWHGLLSPEFSTNYKSGVLCEVRSEIEETFSIPEAVFVVFR